MKTETMIEAAERVRAVYQRDRDSLAQREQTPERLALIAEQDADIAAIDRLLARSGNFFEYLAGDLHHAGVA